MLSPVTGTIRLGANLQISYSDQLLEQLDENKTAIDNVGDGNDTVTVNGKSRHIIGYLQDFLFSPDQARSLVSVLSGGERKRLMLARLFTRPSNLLVLDEPTNDLDIETLDLFEGLLINYTGTILLVSHDRTFINNIVTSTVVFEGSSVVKEYVGGYDDWLRQRPQEAKPRRASASKQGAPPAQVPRPKLKLGFN
jgi:ATP-binding cassette subfamily F protein uup